MQRRFGIVRFWPEHPVAEHENIERIKAAADALDIEVIEIDRNGYLLDGSGSEIGPEDADFVINMHFETAKVYDCFSYGALWNPLHYYFEWGYDRCAANQASHDGYLTAGSRWAEDLAVRETGGAFEREDAVAFNHTLGDARHTAQARNDKTLCYCGINWERADAGPLRHESVLSRLDREGVVVIYGPREKDGVARWDGFQGYQGPLPFDGISIVDAIAECGMSLVFSSNAHRLSGVMSNRLFESLAAGALVVADSHPFVRQHFGDTVLYVDDDADVGDIAGQILAHLRWANDNPQEACQMAHAAQMIFLERFSLRSQLATLYARHADYLTKTKARVLSQRREHSVDIVLPLDAPNRSMLDRILKGLDHLDYPKTKFHFVTDELTAGQETLIGDTLGPRGQLHKIRLSRFGRRLMTGSVLREIWPALEGDLLIVANGAERWFRESVDGLVRPFEDQPDLAAALGGFVLRSKAEDDNEQREFYGALDGFGHDAAVASIIVRRDRYLPLRAYGDYLDGGNWRDFLALSFEGANLARIDHPGLVIDIDAYGQAESARLPPELDHDHQMTIIRRFAARKRPAVSDLDAGLVSDRTYHERISRVPKDERAGFRPALTPTLMGENLFAAMMASPLTGERNEVGRRLAQFLSDTEPEVRAELAENFVESIRLNGFQRYVSRWLLRPIRVRRRQRKIDRSSRT